MKKKIILLCRDSAKISLNTNESTKMTFGEKSFYQVSIRTQRKGLIQTIPTKKSRATVTLKGQTL
jgi:hypothetical protein